MAQDLRGPRLGVYSEHLEGAIAHGFIANKDGYSGEYKKMVRSLSRTVLEKRVFTAMFRTTECISSVLITRFVKNKV